MRHVLVAASALSLMLGTGVAFAQSGQGGYLGSNPGANAPTGAPNQPPQQGSGQGGYLGSNPGGNATSSSGGSGSYPNDPNSGQGNSTYGVPGKVGPDNQHK
jgi:hypothetical protein